MNKNQTKRRDLLKILGAAPAAAALAAQQPTAAKPAPKPQAPKPAGTSATATGAGAAPAFRSKHFTLAEWRTLRVTVDMIIPRDERSGSATEAGVPDYIEELVAYDKGLRGIGRIQAQLKGGLAWLNREAQGRFQKAFADCAADQRKQILDLIAFPAKAAREHAPYVAFFNRLRDLTSTGFYTSKIGIADLGYRGNVAFDWQGPPREALVKLGVENE